MEEKVAAIIAALRERYPDALCALHYGKDYELMISVRLSAQCTDARVNQVTPALFARYPTLDAFAEADVAEVEEYVRSCGFFHHKAQDIVAACRMLRDEYGGRVPDTMEQLLRLPGVGRKTANLLLGDLYGKPAVVCDTHCIRIANRLGLARGKEPEKVERQLRAILPPGGVYGAQSALRPVRAAAVLQGIQRGVRNSKSGDSPRLVIARALRARDDLGKAVTLIAHAIVGERTAGPGGALTAGTC